MSYPQLPEIQSCRAPVFDMDEAKLTQAVKRYRNVGCGPLISAGACGKKTRSRRRTIEETVPELEKELLDTYYQFKVES